MLRLAHRILSQLTTIPPELTGDNFDEYRARYLATRTILRVCPIIIADNVAAHDVEAGQDCSLTGENYSNIAPPFESAWFIEWEVPDAVKQEGITHCGAFFHQLPAEDARKVAGSHPVALEEARWVYIVEYFFTHEGRPALWPDSYLIFVAPSGALLGGRAAYYRDDEHSQLFKDNAPAFLRIPLLTLGYMHCSNVSREDQTKEHGPSPKWCRRMRVPELRYQTLWLGQPGGKRVGTGRKTEGDRSGMSLHICRGYFAHYIDDGVSLGLFGRGIFGTFWIPAHARGSLEHGEVRSTYKIQFPNTERQE